MRRCIRACLALSVCLILLSVSAAHAAYSDVMPGSWYEAAVTQMAQEGDRKSVV